MWVAGGLLALGYLGDAIDYFVFEDPSNFNIVAEMGWFALFLAVVAAVEGALWLTFTMYSRLRKQAKE